MTYEYTPCSEKKHYEYTYTRICVCACICVLCVDTFFSFKNSFLIYNFGLKKCEQKCLCLSLLFVFIFIFILCYSILFFLKNEIRVIIHTRNKLGPSLFLIGIAPMLIGGRLIPNTHKMSHMIQKWSHIKSGI